MNLTTLPFKAGSATKPAPGYNIVILDDEGKEVKGDHLGKICMKFPTPPSFALTLWNKDDQFIEKYFTDFKGHYLTGDAGYKDKDGYIHMYINIFINSMTRLDDIINTAGHRLSTAHMEEVMMTHPLVSEAVVVGVKDEIKGEIPLGFVTLRDGI
jgi:propionyl-CoA synthetase